MADVTVPVRPRVVREHEWRGDGLLCGDCGRELREGDVYSERLVAVASCERETCEPQPVVLIVCVACARPYTRSIAQ